MEMYLDGLSVIYKFVKFGGLPASSEFDDLCSSRICSHAVLRVPVTQMHLELLVCVPISLEKTTTSSAWKMNFAVDFCKSVMKRGNGKGLGLST